MVNKVALPAVLLLHFYFFPVGNVLATNGKGERGIMRTPVKVQRVEKKNLASTLPLMGTINHLSKVDLSSEINGILESVKVEEGDQVQKGQIVAGIDSSLFQAQLKQYQAVLELTKIELLKFENEVKKAEVKIASSLVASEKLQQYLETQKKLFSIGGITQSELDDAEVKYKKAWAEHQTALEELNSLLAKSEEGRGEAEAKVKKAEADVEEIQEKIRKCVLKAPISGVVSVKKKNSGEAVTPDDSVVLTLVEVDDVYAEADLNEKNMGIVKVGQTSKVVTDAYPNQPFWGKVHSLSPVVDTSSRTLKVKIKIANPKRLLKPGMFARVEIMEKGRPSVIAIPDEAVIKTQDGRTHVFVVIDEIAFLRPVEVGMKKDGWIEINKGLKTQEKVVIEGQERLRDLSPVQSTELPR
jgi:multidrug efflux pump subunit AcrA (membrane-fusion protein)